MVQVCAKKCQKRNQESPSSVSELEGLCGFSRSVLQMISLRPCQHLEHVTIFTQMSHVISEAKLNFSGVLAVMLS